jgi:hypothetical protein
MLTVILILIVIGFVGFSCYTAERDFAKAVMCNSKGLYKEAIYYYASATVSSCFLKDVSRGQIASIWKTHGPFDYIELYNLITNSKELGSVLSREEIIEIIRNSSVAA